ncbi:MAG: zinc-binding dehydrogenase [Deltaproteobacteria bacterium]|nr:zinc-binding dehydrogenase [Deltaproteobacteria bacterium]
MTNTALQLRSLVRTSGELELSLVSIPVPAPNPDEVVIRIEATPLNPSDLGLLFGTADMSTARQSGTPSNPVVTASIPGAQMKSMQNRLDKSMPAGNEGAGVVVSIGSSSEVQALLGKTVATFGGDLYSQYRCVPARQCLILPEGTTPSEGAACFVNPLTALCMVETMWREGHTALVNTAAASSLGQMLNRVCIQDKIGLVNIVRTEQQENILRAIGATHVCSTSTPTFKHDLTQALVATGATLAFDAIGGGKLAGQILSCMEAALRMSDNNYSPYGSSTHKQVYIYGGLDPGPTVLHRSFGAAFGIGGWLLMECLRKIGFAAEQRLHKRVVAELKTTFSSHYTKVVSLAEALQLEEIAVYGRRATGRKYLINPNKGNAA